MKLNEATEIIETVNDINEINKQNRLNKDLHLLCRCGDISTYQVSPADVTSQGEEQEVRKHLTLPLSPGGDVTVECVAYNQVGVSRDVFNPRKFHRINLLGY